MAKKRVQVVLNEDVLSLGKNGDLVEVASGYARNFLVPNAKAVPVTAAVLRQVEHRRAKEAERLAALKAEAETLRTALDTIGRFTVKKQTGGDDVLFGTVTNGDVAEAIEAATRKEVDRRAILVPEIHRTGTYKVQVKLHPEVVAEINLEVVSY
jgi:large subunit ribosomal protein L9